MTPAERKAKERDARRDAGLVRLEVYVRPEVREKARECIEKLNRAAMRAAKVEAPER